MLDDTNLFACGLITGTFKAGSECVTIENENNSWRINLQHVPCLNRKNLLEWLQNKLQIRQNEIKEDNFREQAIQTNNADANKNSEAKPFYIVLKTSEAYRRVMARLPIYQQCSFDVAMSSSDGNVRIDGRNKWGAQLRIVMPQDQFLMPSEELMKELGDRAVHCQVLGKKWLPGLMVSNLSASFTEDELSNYMTPIVPTKIQKQKLGPSDIGSSVFMVFFTTRNDREIAFEQLKQKLCNRSAFIRFRDKNGREVNKMVASNVSYMKSKDNTNPTLLITAASHLAAIEIMQKILPKLGSTRAVRGIS